MVRKIPDCESQRALVTGAGRWSEEDVGFSSGGAMTPVVTGNSSGMKGKD